MEQKKNTYPIGEIRTNKFGQDYEIIEKVKYGRIIRFIETKTEKMVRFKELLRGNIVDDNNIIKKTPEENASKYPVGSVYENNDGKKFKVVEVLPKSMRKIKFIESGYEVEVCTKSIKSRFDIKDRLSPTVIGGGIVGTEIVNHQSHPLYNRWWNMLNRCYNTEASRYPLYGAKGVYVCNEWKYFPNYVNDISSKENYDKILKFPNEWDIDKDILISGNKCYSNATTLIVEKKINVGHRKLGHRYTQSVPTHQFSIEGEYIKSYKSRSDAYREVKGIEDKHVKANTVSIRYCERGYKYKTSHGFKWVSDEDFNKYGIGEISNQIKRGER